MSAAGRHGVRAGDGIVVEYDDHFGRGSRELRGVVIGYDPSTEAMLVGWGGRPEYEIYPGGQVHHLDSIPEYLGRGAVVRSVTKPETDPEFGVGWGMR